MMKMTTAWIDAQVREEKNSAFWAPQSAICAVKLHIMTTTISVLNAQEVAPSMGHAYNRLRLFYNKDAIGQYR